jgi:hypothetical protein
MESSASYSTRGGFLRRAGSTLAVGLGIALVPAARARAAGVSCCPDASHCFGQCPQPYVPYLCVDECAQRSCCICRLANTGCDFHPCGICQ